MGETIDDALATRRTVPVSLEPFEGEGRTGTVAQEPFEPYTVTARDVDRGIDAEPAGGLPREHVIGDVALEQTPTHLRWVPRGITEHAVANRVLEFVPVGSREVGGLVELDRALGILAEHAVDDRVDHPWQGIMSQLRMMPYSLLLLLAVACTPDGGPPQTTGNTIWFTGARLIVGDGNAPIENSAFLVEGNRFAWVGRQGEREPPEGSVQVDLTGKTVIPGLIDAHNTSGSPTSRTAPAAKTITRARTSSTTCSGSRTTAWRPR